VTPGYPSFLRGGPEVLHAVVDVVPHVLSSHASVGW
jgi:hypothetical protein